MRKRDRQQALASLTGEKSRSTQSELVAVLAELGRQGAQARVSRDVRETGGGVCAVPFGTLGLTGFWGMSGKLCDMTVCEKVPTKLSGRVTVTVQSKDRPVPLEQRYSDLPLATTLETLVAEN